MVIAEFQVGLALKGFASKVTVPNYRVKWGADSSPSKRTFCLITCIKMKYLDFSWYNNDFLELTSHFKKKLNLEISV